MTRGVEPGDDLHLAAAEYEAACEARAESAAAAERAPGAPARAGRGARRRAPRGRGARVWQPRRKRRSAPFWRAVAPGSDRDLPVSRGDRPARGVAGRAQRHDRAGGALDPRVRGAHRPAERPLGRRPGGRCRAVGAGSSSSWRSRSDRIPRSRTGPMRPRPRPRWTGVRETASAAVRRGGCPSGGPGRRRRGRGGRDSPPTSGSRRVTDLAEVIDETLGLLEAAQRQVHRNLAPILAAAIREWLPVLSGGAYADAGVNPADLSIEVKERGTGAWRQARLLSGGTREQIYLLLRVAMAEHLVTTSEKAPLLLDEVTAQADNDRERAILDMLLALATDRQLILFTHDDAVLSWAEAHLQADRHRIMRLSAPSASAGRRRRPRSSPSGAGADDRPDPCTLDETERGWPHDPAVGRSPRPRHGAVGGTAERCRSRRSAGLPAGRGPRGARAVPHPVAHRRPRAPARGAGRRRPGAVHAERVRRRSTRRSRRRSV